MEICKAIARRLGCRFVNLDELAGRGTRRGACAAVCSNVIVIVEETGVPELSDVDKLVKSIDHLTGRFGSPRHSYGAAPQGRDEQLCCPGTEEHWEHALRRRNYPLLDQLHLAGRRNSVQGQGIGDLVG